MIYHVLARDEDFKLESHSGKPGVTSFRENRPIRKASTFNLSLYQIKSTFGGQIKRKLFIELFYNQRNVKP